MVAKNLLLLSSMVFLLSACGGSESEETTNITAATSSDTINSNSQNVALPSSETIDLTDALATTSIAKLTASGSAVANLVSLNNDVTNAEASLSFSQTSEITQGNVTFLLAVSDEDGINNVDLVLANVNKSIALCNENCGSSFEKSVIGLSPYIYGEVSGSVRIEIWVTDLLNNTVLANTATLNWQPYSISGVTATRDTTSINLSWQENTNVNRYNVYLATEAGVLPNNIEQLNNGQQYLSLTDTDLIIDNVLSDESYQILITGVEGSGESAFSELINIAPLNGELSFSAQAITDNYQTNEDTPVNGNVLTNDINLYLGDLAVVLNTLVQPQYGTLEINELGDFTYTPAANFNGNDVFSYEVSNELGLTDTALVEITVAAINDNPVALNNSYTVNVDGYLLVDAPGLLANDSDIDLDTLSIDTTPVNQPTYGALTLFSDGGFEYQSTESIAINDSFQYRVTDLNGGEAVATVIINASDENTPPIAVNDSYALSEDVKLEVSLEQGLLSNDSDADDNSFTIDESFIISPSHGQLLLSNDGSFSYIPDANFFGVDEFQYQIIDTAGATATALVTLTISNVADNPTAQNDEYTFTQNKLLEISADNGLLINDINIESGSLSVNTNPIVDTQYGTLTLQTNGAFTYQPNTIEFYVDSFSYEIQNEFGLTATAQVVLSKSNENTYPIAVDDSYTIDEDSSNVTFNVLENDSDANGDTITIASIDHTLGEASIIDNQINFTPPSDFYGETTITYTLSDGYSAGINDTNDSTATVNIVVNNINDFPIANNDAITTNEDTAVIVNVTANDLDIDNDTLSVTAATADIGSVTIVDNQLSYMPPANTNGTATLSYTLSDGNEGVATGSLVVTIIAVNDAPIALADNITIEEDSASTLINVLANDLDIDNDALSITAATTDIGTVSIISNKLQYTPPADTHGTATITYAINDGNEGSATANVAVTINSVNDVPVAVNDTASMDEDAAPITIDVLANDTDIDNDALSITAASA
ncbi:tandem-95 repeat protein, partial [Pseudoalteromonas sp. MMG010]|uniref:Ig-like domain-containing protein n=1 Tax=Pseudoalteromonas sp. MMG010 TaxID=2822685 RepID=UPI001B39FD9D